MNGPIFPNTMTAKEFQNLGIRLRPPEPLAPPMRRRTREKHRHFDWPYCVEPVDEQRWIVVNRRYKPLGYTHKEYVDYATYPDAVYVTPFSPAVARACLVQEDDYPRTHFYLDGSALTTSRASLKAYLGRIKRFLDCTDCTPRWWVETLPWHLLGERPTDSPGGAV